MPMTRQPLLLAAFLIGAGLMAAIDEIVFHQWLGWHHFVDTGSSDFALVSDGFLHAGELVALVAGGFLWADAARRGPLDRAGGWAGLWMGAGGFQLFDGWVDHKLLRIHQVRYVCNLLPYDVAWDGAGLALLLLGASLYWHRQRRPAR